MEPRAVHAVPMLTHSRAGELVRQQAKKRHARTSSSSSGYECIGRAPFEAGMPNVVASNLLQRDFRFHVYPGEKQQSQVAKRNG